MTTYLSYENLIQPARQSFAEDKTVISLLNGNVQPGIMMLFLVNFSSLGVAMTEPVSRWISSAGKKCEEIGLLALGRALISHARHEEGHEKLMIEDTNVLIRNSKNIFPHLDLDPNKFLNQPLTSGVRKYRDLHEETIRSDKPYRQLAIEYEIENLSVVYGPQIIKQSARLLGNDILTGLSFIQDHVQFDVGHTKFNQKELSTLLEMHPEFLESLVQAGSQALDSYRMFLCDCMNLAEAMAKDML